MRYHGSPFWRARWLDFHLIGCAPRHNRRDLIPPECEVVSTRVLDSVTQRFLWILQAYRQSANAGCVN